MNVLAWKETPYYYVSDGNRIAFVRVGNESVPANAVDLKRLVLRGRNSTYDSLSPHYSFADQAFTKLRSVYRHRTGLDLVVSDFESFGLMDGSGTLTNAGVLLADESPMKFSRILCACWNGLSKASGVMDALDDKEVSGSLISLLQSGEEFVRNNTKKRWEKTDTGRLKMSEYPQRAVLGCLVNALIHRDYMVPGSEVHIDIFDNRLEIYSPGGMVDGTLVQNLDLEAISSKRRNPIIADIFNRMNYMERCGSGFRKIKEDYHKAENFRPELEPLFYSDASSFWVTLYNLNYQVPIEKEAFESKEIVIDVAIEAAIDGLPATKNTKEMARMVYVQMANGRVFGRTDIGAITHDSVTAAGNLINKLKEAGLIEAVNGHGKGKYRFIQQ